ncbi:hypothetical protein [Deinococcus radiophilus]|nr:hypothetical protein [Deinococcus radiophilus]UFA50549.1 hypothetical protein LMT64_01120 [Deinococcus radiophilus]
MKYTDAPLVQMNRHFRITLTRLINHAERDLRLARTAQDMADANTAKARLNTLEAALGIYTAAHFHAYGERPWPEEEATHAGR